MVFEKIKIWASELKLDVMALWIAVRDPRTPMSAKIVSAFVTAYALSPIDLIPDFIPILGYIDDLLLIPIGILLAVRLTPLELMENFRKMALSSVGKTSSYAGAVGVVSIWLLSVGLFVYFFWVS